MGGRDGLSPRGFPTGFVGVADALLDAVGPVTAVNATMSSASWSVTNTATTAPVDVVLVC